MKLSIDLNREARDEDSSLSGRQESSSDNTPADEVVNLEEMALDCVKHMTALDESLTEFEEERLSILDQLKVLEEKLISVGDDEFIEDLKSINQPSNYAVNEFDKNHDFSSPTENGDSNDFSKDGLYPEKKTMASMAKSLLPLLDATGNETEGLIYEEQAEFDSVEIQNSSVSTFDLDNKRLAIVEEVDHVYERLQALEADREFLKHCVSSVKKGDKDTLEGSCSKEVEVITRDCFLHDDIADKTRKPLDGGGVPGLNHVKPKFCHIYVPLTAPFSWKSIEGEGLKGKKKEGIILSSPSLGLVKYHEFPVSGSS
ncbi:hypothetical protein Pint_18575 [Pistacia integerrima]|uniref:Uncharacterized protein n=1 Tax=Pistacia integerrima TaxID=434235 RepID=A0ACC0YXY7_9ROSI|nr:hypothetical protein Pint_18575 [Pistacia integerrima]